MRTVIAAAAAVPFGVAIGLLQATGTGSTSAIIALVFAGALMFVFIDSSYGDA